MPPSPLMEWPLPILSSDLAILSRRASNSLIFLRLGRRFLGVFLSSNNVHRVARYSTVLKCTRQQFPEFYLRLPSS